MSPLPQGYVNSRSIMARGVKINPAAVVYEPFTNVPAAVTNGISVSHNGAAAAGTTQMTIGGSLATGGVANLGIYPRNVVITVTAVAVVAMSGVISGYDSFGNFITEAWSVTAGGASKTFTGKKAFKLVTSITEVVAADASGNAIVAGTGNVLGLSAACSCPSLVKETANGAVVTNGVLAAASTAATDDARGTYTPNTAPNGTNDYEVWYLSNQPELTA
jgi:hypothetical protein